MASRSTTLLALAIVGALAACGGDDGAATSSTPEGVNEADVEFAQGMIAHHEQAIEMSEIALDPAMNAGADVTDLATRVQAAQDPEIDQMTSWLEAWGEPVQMDLSDGHDMSEMEGMMTADEMDALSSATGEDFDRLWLEMMIEHHQGAISMSTDVQDQGSDPGVAALAEQIVADQQAEIGEMESLLAG